jgi:hypothetical protein
MRVEKMAAPKLNFKFIKDEPKNSKSNGYKGFYHTSVAPALKKILKDDSSPHTIGLFGAWGTGKSTIVEMVQNDKQLNMPVFLFDAWKYQEDTLRRTFLIKLVEYLRKENYDIDDEILTPVYASTSTSVTVEREVEKNDSKPERVIKFIRRYILPILFVGSIIGIILFATIWKDSPVAQFANFASQFILLSTVVGKALSIAGEELVKGAVSKLIGSQTAQTEVFTRTHQQDRLNSPEQFEQKFIEILSKVDKKLIIVFDNIDRVQGDVAISMLSTIKTFMYSGGENKIVFLVPCDPGAIEVQVKKYFHGDNFEQIEGVKDSFEASEYLRKIFNLILWVPEFINSDLEEYTRALLKETGSDVGKLLNDEDVVLVINAAFSNNPREIIQFINNLVALIITVEGTKVKDIIYEKIAYLAKVLVLRQKFPDAYEQLKIAWFTPEKIYTVSAPEEVVSPLRIFMQNTSRITVDNAEPFIYFKDTSDTRGIKSPSELATALAAASTETAAELTKSEDSTKLLLFIADQVKRYSTQEKALLNVVLTQFSIIKAHGIDTSNKKYINDLVHFIDTSLWGRHAELPIDDMFTALNNTQLDKNLRVKIVDRYLAALDTDEAILPLKRQIIDAFRKTPALLSNVQKTKLRGTLESRYSDDEETLALFTTTTEQEEFISKGLISTYIGAINYENIPTRLQALFTYKEFLVNHDLLQNIIDIGYSLLDKDMTATTAYNENKKAIVDAVGVLVDKFKPDIKNHPDNLSNLVAELVKIFSSASQWEQKAEVVNALFWLEGSVSDADDTAITNAVHSYFQSWGNLEQIQKTIDTWEEDDAQDLIRIALPALLNRLTSDQNVLQYLYNKAAKEEKSTIIHHVISQVTLDNPYDINFISQLTELPDRKVNIASLLEKAGRISWNRKQPYYSYIASRIEPSDGDLKATAIEQVKALIMSGDSQQGEIGLNFLNDLNLTASEKRAVPAEVLTWLRDPGRSISNEHRVALRVVAESYSSLQDTAKKDFVFFLFSLLDQSRDLQSTQMTVSSLVSIQPKYKDFSKDFDDLLTRLQAWPDTQTKQHIYQELPKLSSGGRLKAEKIYWESFSALYPQEET